MGRDNVEDAAYRGKGSVIHLKYPMFLAVAYRFRIRQSDNYPPRPFLVRSDGFVTDIDSKEI